MSKNNHKHQWKNEEMQEYIITLKEFEGATVAASRALAEIKKNELYKEHYETLKEFCEQELGWTKQRWYQLLEFHEIRESLPSKSQPRLTSERQARALANVPEKDRVKVLKEAEKSGKVTAKSITQAAKVISVDVIQCDREGHQIPSGAAEKTWNRRDEVDEYLVWLSRIKSWAEKLQKSSDTFYAVKEFSAQEVYTDCGNMYRMIKNLVPWSICAACQGQAPKSCALCHGKGMISKHTWDRGVDSVTKKMMKQKAEDDKSKVVSAASH